MNDGIDDYSVVCHPEDDFVGKAMRIYPTHLASAVTYRIQEGILKKPFYRFKNVLEKLLT